jgi:hypothetical protein
MRTDLELFEMYKEEKALIVGDFQTRTGLEPFPTFKEWKKEYTKDYLETHQTVSIKDADKIMDSLVDEASDQIEEWEKLLNVTKTDSTKRTEKVKARKEKKMKKATSVKNPKAKTSNSTKTQVNRKNNKAAASRETFNKMYPDVLAGTIKRKDVIEVFVNKVGLTPAGASTYYQKHKAEF